MTRFSMPCVASLTLATLLLVSTSIIALSQASPQQSTPDGLRLLHKMQQALGGAKRIAAIRDYEEVVRAEARDANGADLGAVRKRTRWIRTPNLLRLDQVGPRGTYVLYLDGSSDSGWEILPDLNSPNAYQTTKAPVDLTGGELKFARDYLSGFELTMWMADQTSGYCVISPRPNVLRIEHDGEATDYTLDPAAWLPLKSSGVSLADPNRPVPAELVYDRWKEFSGVRFPTHRVNYHNGVNRGEVFTESIRINSSLEPQKLSAKPADLMPDIPR